MPLPRVLTETVLTFAQATKACPAIDGKKPSVKTVYTWADIGILVGGERVKLESAKVGGKRVTSAEAIERFVEATSTGTAPPVIRTPAARRRESEKAMQFLRDEFAKV